MRYQSKLFLFEFDNSMILLLVCMEVYNRTCKLCHINFHA